MTGGERMLVLCSPHNPGGRVWTRQELEQIADFAVRHDLILVSDEIHHDLVYPGQTHTPMTVACARHRRPAGDDDGSASKTFNLAGSHTGNVTIADPDLRRQFAARMAALGVSPNAFGLTMTQAAYSPEGAQPGSTSWSAISTATGGRSTRPSTAIPGVRSMPLEATYLSWVDFSGTGMQPEEFTCRVEGDAAIAVNHGPTFGEGGDGWLRFNLAMPRARIEEAGDRLRRAFGDLQ